MGGRWAPLPPPEDITHVCADIRFHSAVFAPWMMSISPPAAELLAPPSALLNAQTAMTGRH